MSRGRVTRAAQYVNAPAMSVPPPSCTPKRTSTGSSSSSLRSTTAVSNTTSRMSSERTEASTAANTEAYTTEAAIDPLWSRQRMISRSTWGERRP